MQRKLQKLQAELRLCVILLILLRCCVVFFVKYFTLHYTLLKFAYMIKPNTLSTLFAGKVKFTKNGQQQFSCACCVVGSIPTNSLRIECFSIERSENASYRLLRWTNLFMVSKSLTFRL